MLAPSSFRNYNPPESFHGMKKCGKKRCKMCEIVLDTKYFLCHHTNRKFKIRGNFNCDSKLVVYCLRCQKCKRHYIGSTVNFRDRTNRHKSHIRRQNLKEGCKYLEHFVNHCISSKENPFKNVEIFIIDGLRGSFDRNSDPDREKVEEFLLRKEQFWIATTLAFHKGLNSSKDWSTRQRQNW